MAKELEGYSVRISTPAHDGRYSELYVLGICNTFQLLNQMGARVDWGRMPACSDIVFARNRLLGSFIRSKDTHNVFIDSDIGFKPEDVVRLLLSGKEFCAGAYHRKLPDDSFAVDPGPDNNFMEPAAVGLGFSCMTRGVILKIIEKYPELLYIAPEGEQEYALCLPYINERKQYRGEDYAFCDRVRSVGAKLSIIPDIDLKHVGSGTCIWSGSLLDVMIAAQKQQQAAE